MNDSKFRTDQMRALDNEAVRSPRQVRVSFLERAEDLLCTLTSGEACPFDSVYTAVMQHDPPEGAVRVIAWDDLVHDLLALARDLSESVRQRADEVGEPFSTVDDLAAQFKVSPRTIGRWRAMGLCARRVIFDDGKPRIVILQRHLDAFAKRHEAMIRRARGFSHMTPKERQAMIAFARALPQKGVRKFAAVVSETAARFGRNADTVRRVLRAHLRSVAPESGRRLDVAERLGACDMLRAVASVDDAARKFACARADVHRAWFDSRAAELLAEKVAFMPNDIFDHPNADRLILGDELEMTEDNADPAAREPLLTRQLEADLFRRYNYLKFKWSKLLEEVAAAETRAGLVLRTESVRAHALAIKRRLVRANMGLVVSIARRHIGGRTDISRLISDGNLSLMMAVEKFDFARGFKFSTYASWAIIKNFAKSIPEENYKLDAFVTGAQEFIDATGAVDGERVAEERLPFLREYVSNAIDKLSKRERRILVSRFGLGGSGDPRTLEQVGRDMGLSKERVRQIQRGAIEKLRDFVDPEAAATSV